MYFLGIIVTVLCFKDCGDARGLALGLAMNRFWLVKAGCGLRGDRGLRGDAQECLDFRGLASREIGARILRGLKGSDAMSIGTKSEGPRPVGVLGCLGFRDGESGTAKDVDEIAREAETYR